MIITPPAGPGWFWIRYRQNTNQSWSNWEMHLILGQPPFLSIDGDTGGKLPLIRMIRQGFDIEFQAITPPA